MNSRRHALQCCLDMAVAVIIEIYQIRASAGYGSNGKQIVKTMTWAPSEVITQKQLERELNRVTVDFERRVESGQCIDSNTRFSDYANIWIKKSEESGEKPLSPKTLVRYKILLVRIWSAAKK